jgi:sugar/nucleoside kinase (ribokinase family)
VIRVGVLGPATIDIVDLPGREPVRRPGGTTLYAARALRFAGAEPAVIENPGLVISRLRHTPEGTVQAIDAVASPADPAWLAERLDRFDGCSWVMLGGQTANDFPVASIAMLVERGHHTLLDLQGLARGSRPGPVELRPFPLQAIGAVHAVKLNAAEARAAVGGDTPEHVRRLGVAEALFSRGPEGALLITPDGEFDVPASAEAFDDPTGAGDSLAALYSLARTRGAEPPEAIRFAVERVERLYTGGFRP